MIGFDSFFGYDSWLGEDGKREGGSRELVLFEFVRQVTGTRAMAKTSHV